MKKVFLVIYLLLFFVNNVNASVHESDLPRDYPYSRECFRIFDTIINNKVLDSSKKMLFEWARYKKQCDFQGIYAEGVAVIYLEFDHSDVAIEILRESIKNANFNIVSNALALASILTVQKNYLEAIDICNMLIEKYPDYWDGYSLLGQIYVYKEKLGLAKKYLEKAYSINSGVAFTNIYLSTVYYEERRYEEVVRLYESGYKDMPDSVILQQRPMATMILSLIELGRYEEAKRYFREWEENDDSLGACQWYETVKQRMKEVGIDR